MQRLFLPAAAGGLIALLAGCGGGDPFAYVPVSGKVTYDDGSKIPRSIELRFLPLSQKALDEKTYPRCGVAIVDGETGEFNSATSHQAGDGWRRANIKWRWRPRTSGGFLPTSCRRNTQTSRKPRSWSIRPTKRRST